MAKAYLETDGPIGWTGFAAGVAAVGLASVRRSATAVPRKQHRYVYRVRVPAGAAINLADVGPGSPPAALHPVDVDRARRRGQDLLVPFAALQAVRIDRVYRPGSTFAVDSRHPLLGARLADLHRPARVPGLASLPHDRAGLDALDAEMTSAATAAVLFAATPARERWRYSVRPRWYADALVRVDATDTRIAFEQGLAPVNVYDVDVVGCLRAGDRPVGGLLGWDGGHVRQVPRAGGFIYAAYLPGGIDPVQTLPLLPGGDEVAARLGEGMPTVLTPGGVRSRHLAGAYPVRHVDTAARRIVLGTWRPNINFAGVDLLGAPVDAAGAVAQALARAGYSVVPDTDGPDPDLYTIGAGYGVFAEPVFEWFAARARQVATQLAGTPPQGWLRSLQGLVRELGERSGRVSGPPVRVRYVDAEAPPGAHFDIGRWSVGVLRSRRPPDPDGMAALLHGIRHAEQVYLIARLMAGWGGEPTDLARRLPCHTEVLRRALADPLRPGDPWYQAAVEWWYAGFGPGSVEASAAATALAEAQVDDTSATRAYRRAVAAGGAVSQNRSDLWAARRALEAAKQRYHSVAVEADAFAVEAAIRGRWQNRRRDWRDPGAVSTVRVPTGYQVTRTEAGLHIRRAGTSVPAPARTGQAFRLRVTVDPQMGTLQDPDLPAIRELLDTMTRAEPVARAIVDVGEGPPLSPEDAAALADKVHGRRGALRAALAVPVARLTTRPPRTERVVPIDARGRGTGPDQAVEYLFLPEGAPREFATRPVSSIDPVPQSVPSPGPAPVAPTATSFQDEPPATEPRPTELRPTGVTRPTEPRPTEVARPAETARPAHVEPPVATPTPAPAAGADDDVLAGAYAAVENCERRRQGGEPLPTSRAELDRLYAAYRTVIAAIRSDLDSAEGADAFRATNLAVAMAVQTIERRLSEPRSAEALARISDGYRSLNDTLANVPVTSPPPQPVARPHVPAPAVPGGTGTPDAFGLAAPAVVASFARAALGVAGAVAGESDQQRLARLGAPLAELLAKVGVPPLAIEVDPAAVRARFGAAHWIIRCAPGDDDDFVFLENLYHQARHAEQVFVAMRWQAGRSMLGWLALFRQRSRVSREVLRAARENPLRQQPVAAAAGARWWRDWFGADAAAAGAATALALAAAERQRAHAEYQELVVADATTARRRAAKNSLWRARYTLIMRAEEYARLPQEHDADRAARALRHAWGESVPPSWLRPLTLATPPTPPGHVLTRTAAGLHLRREQDSPRGARVDVAQWLPHPFAVRVTVDPNVIDWDAVYQVLDLLPAGLDEQARWPILHLPGSRMMAPVDAQSMAGRHMGERGSRGAVAIPADMLTRRPSAGQRVVPVDEHMRMTSPEAAAEYLFFPPELPAPRPDHLGFGAVEALTAAPVPGRPVASAPMRSSPAEPLPAPMTVLGRPVPSEPGADRPVVGSARATVPADPPRPEAAPEPVPVGTAAVAAPPGVPGIPQLDSMVRVSGSLGTRRGGVFADPDGRRWYVKAARSRLHAENELLAARFYELFGIGTANPRLIALDRRLGGGFGVAAPMRSDVVTLGSVGGPGHLTEAQLEEVWAGFGVDAWLANWGVAGTGFTNILLSPTGLLRVGLGSTLLFRAGGRLKGDRFSVVVGEIDTFKATWRRPYIGALFTGMTRLAETASALPVVGMTATGIRDVVFGVVSDRARAEAISAILLERKDDLAGNYGGVLYRKTFVPPAPPGPPLFTVPDRANGISEGHALGGDNGNGGRPTDHLTDTGWLDGVAIPGRSAMDADTGPAPTGRHRRAADTAASPTRVPVGDGAGVPYATSRAPSDLGRGARHAEPGDPAHPADAPTPLPGTVRAAHPPVADPTADDDEAARAMEVERLWNQINDRLRLVPVSMRDEFADVLSAVESDLRALPASDTDGPPALDEAQQLRFRAARDTLASLAQRMSGGGGAAAIPEEHLPEAILLLEEALDGLSDNLGRRIQELEPLLRRHYQERFAQVRRELDSALTGLSADSPTGRPDRRGYAHMLTAYERIQGMADALDSTDPDW